MTKEITRKIMIILILFTILITSLTIKSFAADYTCTLTIEADKTKILAGESVTLSIKVSNINAGAGIAIFNTTLEYDANVFDVALKADNEGAWTNTKIENSLTFTKGDYEATTKDQEIGKVVLTAKKDVNIGEQKITFKKNEFSEATTFSVPDITKTIEIVKDESGGDNNQGGNNTGGNNNNTGNNNQSNNTTGGNIVNPPSGGNTTNPPSGGTGNTSSVDSGKSNIKLPKTGVQDYLVGAIVVVTIVATVFYIKYKRSY